MALTIQRHRIDKIPRDKLIDELRRVAEHYECQYFSGREFDKISTICKAGTVLRTFGTWKSALGAAGINVVPTRKPRIDRIPEHELFAELERIWRLRGHRPSRSEWEASSPQFSYATYKRRFGGWTRACVQFIEFNSVGSLPNPQQASPVHESQFDDSPGVMSPSEKRDVPSKLRLRVLDRDKFKCVFCGRSPATHVGVTLHLDHKVPFSAGGKTVFENLQVLCQQCNLGKGSAGVQGP